MSGDGKQRSRAKNVSPGRAGRGARQGHRHQAARLPFKQQHLHRQQNCRDRRCERRRHSRRRSRHQQSLALHAGQMKELRDHRSKRSAAHDDRAFGAERSAAANRNRGGNWLQNREARLHPAAVDENRLESLGNAVAADFFRAVACHQAHDDRTQHRNQDGPRPQRIPGRRHQHGVPAMIVEQIREQTDQPEQGPGHARCPVIRWQLRVTRSGRRASRS